MRTQKTTGKTTKRTVTKATEDPWNRTGANSLKKELNGWLESRTIWNHEDWQSLIFDLRTKGYSDLVDTPKGQDAIGFYLETNRKGGSC
ncbi:MAG TPA: hypothetical protein PLZ86_04940 [bacterium]|nr:hypothetical protein [bacterium]